MNTSLRSPLNSTDRVKVAIVEDHADVRKGLSILINQAPGFMCTAVFSSMEEAISGVGLDLPQILLVDIGLPGISGVDGISILKKQYPALLFVILTVYEDDERIFNALCAGACGYLLKKIPPSRLLESLQEVMGGGAPISPEVARRVIQLFREIRPPHQAEHHLTPHETRILKLLVEGHNYKTAAAELGVSINTISFHMRHIYEKLQVHSKSEAVSKALRSHLIR